jgi:PadR family transcriptional regulator, regulatory protein PadR
MSMEHGCDMRGMLSFQILWLLSKKPMHGEELAKEIEKRRGEKPKASSIYPALKELKERGQITGSKKGKIITYSLTADGRKSTAAAKKYFVKCFREIIEG